MNARHKIYLCDICFPKNTISSDERELRMTSELYKDMYNRRQNLTHVSWNDIHSHDFVGLVDYIPKVYGGNIKEAADILIYLYKNKGIIGGDIYNGAISLISSFIINNDIESIELSGDDVKRLKVNGLDIVKDIMDNMQTVNKNLIISVSPIKRSSYGYHLI